MNRHAIDIEEESDNRLVLTMDTRLFSHNTYIISTIISLTCLIICLFIGIVLYFLKELEYGVFLLFPIIIFTLIFSCLWSMNKVMKLINNLGMGPPSDNQSSFETT